jgi:tellurite resistance protein
MLRGMRIIELLPPGPIANAAHAEAYLELAWLMTAADGRFTDEERRAYDQILTRVRGTPGDVDATVQRFAREGHEAKERIRALGPTLPTELRESVFKIAIALALVDDDASPHEDALMHVYFEALGLDPARAEALATEARAIR